MSRTTRSALAATLLAAMAIGIPGAAAAARVERAPQVAELGRFAVAGDRRGDRLPGIARRLLAQDLLLERWLAVPNARLRQPVTALYLHGTRGMHRRLPFRGDRIGHEHLVPTDTRLWVLVREDTGLEDCRPAELQVAEYGLMRGAGELPAWLRAGMYELLARVDLQAGRLILAAAPFPALHEAGLQRAPLEQVAAEGWNRYQEPRRWYAATMLVAYLFDERTDALSAAIADPASFVLEDEVDLDAFQHWVDRAVTATDETPRVLERDLDFAPVVRPLGDEELRGMLVTLASTHPRGLRAFQLGGGEIPSRVAAQAYLRAGGEADGCAGIAGAKDPEDRYLDALCHVERAPGTAEEQLRQLFRGHPGLHRAGIQAAAMALGDGERDGDAGHLVEQVLQVAPGDADAQLLEALVQARRGDCPGWDVEGPGRLVAPWDPILLAPGPMDRRRDAFVREILECE